MVRSHALDAPVRNGFEVGVKLAHSGYRVDERARIARIKKEGIAVADLVHWRNVREEQREAYGHRFDYGVRTPLVKRWHDEQIIVWKDIPQVAPVAAEPDVESAGRDLPFEFRTQVSLSVNVQV